MRLARSRACGVHASRTPRATGRHQVRRPSADDDETGLLASGGAHSKNPRDIPMPTWLLSLDRFFPIRYLTWIACAIVMLVGAFTQVVAHTGGALGRAGPGRRDHRPARRAPAPPLDPAQLPGHRAPALPVRVHPPRDAPVLHRGRQRGRAVLAPAALARLPARQGRPRQAPAGHAARRPGRRLRVDQPLAAADDARVARLPRDDRPELRAALRAPASSTSAR